MEPAYYVLTDGDTVRFDSLRAAWRYFWSYCQAYAIYRYDAYGQTITIAGRRLMF